MSLLNGNSTRAREIIDFHMASEPPEFKAKVFEILNFSGLEPNDPMFLALLLTGQIRVFIEAAIEELPRLLSEWKQEMAESFSKLKSAMAEISEKQQEQVEAIQESVKAVSQKCVSDIKEAGMSTVGAIADANQETLEQIQQTKRQVEDLYDEVRAMRATIEADKRKNHQANQALLHKVEQSTIGFSKINTQIDRSVYAVKQLQQNATWLKLAEVISSFPALVIVGLFSMGIGWWLASYSL